MSQPSLYSAAPEPLFDWLRYDYEVMTEARRSLGCPSQDDRPFALSLRIITIDDSPSVVLAPYMWWSDGEQTFSEPVPFPRKKDKEEQARALAPLALSLITIPTLAAEITEFMPKPTAGKLSVHGQFFVTAHGAIIIRDFAREAVARDGGHGHVFPILPTPPTAHVRMTQVSMTETAVHKIFGYDDQSRKALQGYRYRVGEAFNVGKAHGS